MASEKTIAQVPPETIFLPEQGKKWITCGKLLVEWDYAVVYVHQKARPYEAPTCMYFTFHATGKYSLYKVAKIADQWTYFRGKCNFVIAEGTEEFVRAKGMACKVVATYRRNYLKKHGSPPNPLLLTQTLDENLERLRTKTKVKHSVFQQQFKMDLGES